MGCFGFQNVGSIKREIIHATLEILQVKWNLDWFIFLYHRFISIFNHYEYITANLNQAELNSLLIKALRARYCLASVTVMGKTSNWLQKPPARERMNSETTFTHRATFIFVGSSSFLCVLFKTIRQSLTPFVLLTFYFAVVVGLWPETTRLTSHCSFPDQSEPRIARVTGSRLV